MGTPFFIRNVSWLLVTGLQFDFLICILCLPLPFIAVCVLSVSLQLVVCFSCHIYDLLHTFVFAELR